MNRIINNGIAINMIIVDVIANKALCKGIANQNSQYLLRDKYTYQ